MNKKTNKQYHNVGTDTKLYRKQIVDTKLKSIPIPHTHMTGHFHGLVHAVIQIFSHVELSLGGAGPIAVLCEAYSVLLCVLEPQ